MLSELNWCKMKNMSIRSDCRLCGHKLSDSPILSLKPTPPANEFVSDVSVIQEEFPIDIFVCPNCGHVQLPVIVDPSRLFGHYVYVSGTSPVFVGHFVEYAKQMVRMFDLSPGDFVIDIGSNDGTLLRQFKNKHDMRVLGIDPAQEISAMACVSGIPTISQFFTSSLVKNIIGDGDKARLILANNMFAHADNLGDIADGIKLALHENGVFVFEVSYLVDVCEQTLFDTMYHEHLSYHAVTPLIQFFKCRGMRIFDAERINTHGGSIRIYVTHENNNIVSSNPQRLEGILKYESENGYSSPDCPPLCELSIKIEELRSKLVSKLLEIQNSGKTVAAFGAPAKATTLMYHFGLDKNTIKFIVDDSPLKQGLFTPGKHVPVFSSKAIEELKPDYLVILAWNFADSIIQKNKEYMERGGTFIVPIPNFREVSHV